MSDEQEKIALFRAERDAERTLVAQLRRQAEIDTAALNAERALTDFLYATLDRLIPDAGVLGPSVVAAKARYREARA